MANQFTPARPEDAAFYICVDSLEGGQVSGQVVSRRLSKAMPFDNLGSLVLRLEDVLEVQNFPQAFQRSRSFQPREVTSAYAAGGTGHGMPASEVTGTAAGVEKFMLQVLTRRNSTWQGRVTWQNGDSQDFSSDLELFHLTEEHFF